MVTERHAAIRAIVAERGGYVPSTRDMACALTARLGRTVSRMTVARDYAAIGLRRAPVAAQVVHVSLPASVFDAYSRLARQRGVSVQAVVRAAVVGYAKCDKPIANASHQLAAL